MQVRECKGAGLAELNGGTGMHLFEPTLSPIVCCSFGFVFVEIYLTLSKLWWRKHGPRLVDSSSAMSKVVGLVPVTVFAIDCMDHSSVLVHADGLAYRR